MKEFLALLKMIITPDNFHLVTLKTRDMVDADGVIGPGDYLAGELTYLIRTAFDLISLSLPASSWTVRNPRFIPPINV